MLYAIGDIHGRFDLLKVLHQKIMNHSKQFNENEIHTIITLGDYIDRGPQSKEVLDFLMSEPFDGFEHVFLKGNHEEMMILTLGGGEREISHWVRNGGKETCESFKISPNRLLDNPPWWKRTLSPYIRWLSDLKIYHQTHKFVFVHAGIDPDLYHDMTLQNENVLLWIRNRFLLDRRHYGFKVIHGHTPVDMVESLDNRINVDTGACWTGKLTAVCLDENDERKPEFIYAVDRDLKDTIKNGDEKA